VMNNPGDTTALRRQSPEAADNVGCGPAIQTSSEQSLNNFFAQHQRTAGPHPSYRHEEPRVRTFA
jgi:hypothetical protein